jgi:diguanylate cyclase (GGDEF)-like protein
MEDPNIVGTMIQLTGTLLVSVLCSILLQTVRTSFLYYWGYGWGAMSAALVCLMSALVLSDKYPDFFPFVKSILFPAYCFAEYAAGFFWIAGCRSLASGTRLAPRDLIWAFPAGVAAVILPRVVDNPNVIGLLAFHALHALMKTGIYATAFAILYRNREKARGAGTGVMMATFFMLTVDYVQYAVLCTYSFASARPEAFPHLKYASLYELMLEMLLAFGMVMVVMEYVRHELESANLELRKAGSRLKKMAECDPLTGALNRHAFEEFTSAPPGDHPPPLTGTVALLDLDNLKPINDTLGHAAGDQTIQLVAQTIRSVIRPDDLLFRWGGDEFLILWIGALKESDAEMRLDRLNEEVGRNARSTGLRYPIEPSVSFGVATFETRADLDAAIQTADARMYSRKQAKKKAG